MKHNTYPQHVTDAARGVSSLTYFAAHRSPRAANVETKTAPVLVSHTARASKGARASYSCSSTSKFAGKTQVGKPKPGASAPSVDTQGAPGSGFMFAFLTLALLVMIAGTSWAVMG